MSSEATDSANAAVFLDVDGTLVQTTIVHYYMYFRRRNMSTLAGKIWHAAYMLKCVYYLILDKIDRSKLNLVFYRSYAGLSAEETRSQAAGCFRNVIEPRLFRQSLRCLNAHRELGRRVVLVTGSIDFIVAPLAEQLGVADVVAPSLVESNGRFTGELDGPPISDGEKARRMRKFAEDHQIDLADSHAYGDSIADLPMLEAVGHPHAVNPDKALAATAKERGWPILKWTVDASSKEPSL